jgi:hypothetical protein
MSKIQTIIVLLVVVVVAVSMKQMFFKDANVKEKDTFINGTGLGYLGKRLKYNPPAKVYNHDGNMGYPGLQYLGTAGMPVRFVRNSDDSPLSYGFSSTM